MKKALLIVGIVGAMTVTMPSSYAHVPAPTKLCTSYQIDVWKFDHSVISRWDGTKVVYIPTGITYPDKAVLTCVAWRTNWKKFEVDQ